MNINFGDDDIVGNNENMLIHIFYHLFDYDLRLGFFSDESSIYDMGTSGLTEQDYFDIANEYNEKCPENYSYSEGMQFYNKLSNDKFDKVIASKFEKTYGFPFDENKHFLKDLVMLFHDKFPNRNWDTEVLFIIKTLDNRFEKEKSFDIENQKNKKVIKIPVRKKLSPEELKNSSNEYLLVKELGMTWEEATKLANENFDKKYLGQKFTPYLPQKKSTKPKV